MSLLINGSDSENEADTFDELTTSIDLDINTMDKIMIHLNAEMLRQFMQVSNLFGGGERSHFRYLLVNDTEATLIYGQGMNKRKVASIFI